MFYSPLYVYLFNTSHTVCKFIYVKSTLLFRILRILHPHHGLSSPELLTGRREVRDSIPDRACRPNRSAFSLVFSKFCVNMG